MKKITLLLMGLVALSGLVSCDDKDPEQTAQFQQEFYIRSVNTDDNSVKFSKSLSVVTANYTKNEMDITISAKLDEVSSATIQIKGLVLDYDALTGMFSIRKGTNTTVNGGASVGDFDGTFDYNTGIMYVYFVADGKYNVFCTTRLLYPYGTSLSTYEKDGAVKTCLADDFCLAIELNDEGTKAKLTLYNVALEDETSKVIYIDYSAVPVTVRPDGYSLEAAALSATIDNVPKTDYDITNFKAVINRQGRFIDGLFTINGHLVTFRAKMLNDSLIL